ncbi:hypothetical protein [Shouchella clausii]|uniref:Uncharacterized protein n=1 Tax=Shouchella clausii TaxID=79880 RepID=A0A268P635_SHOCL|nr:hypothetical protein [Shouchella clausii]PAE90720.1 hypothetical protein CHH72_02240 [Shouchella clausii]
MIVEFVDMDNHDLLHQIKGEEAKQFLDYTGTINKVHLRISKDLSFQGAIAEMIYDLDYIRGTPSQRIEVRLANIQIRRLN